MGIEEKRTLEQKVDELALAMEKMKLAEYVDYLHNTKRMLAVNLMAGVARGQHGNWFYHFRAMVIIARQLVVLNLPLIGDFIAELVRIVNERMSTSL